VALPPSGRPRVSPRPAVRLAGALFIVALVSAACQSSAPSSYQYKWSIFFDSVFHPDGLIINGVWLTVTISIVSQTVGVVLGIVAAVMVATFVIHVWRTAPRMKGDMERQLETATTRGSRVWSLLAVFGFTVFMVTREGMETALMLIQVRTGRFILGSLLGIGAAALMAWAWAHFGHRINLRRFFQVTGLFLLLFTLQIVFYSIHEFSEAGVLPNSDAIHTATEPFSPVGVYGKWFSLLMVLICALWLALMTLKDRMAAARQADHDAASPGMRSISR